MKFGYMCPYNNINCGETEARKRITYCLNKLGHEVTELNSLNYTFDSNVYAENFGLDFILSHAVIEQKNMVYPDIFSCFFYWCPPSFLSTDIMTDYLLYMNKHDVIAGGYESGNTVLELSNTNFFPSENLLRFFASVPLDWVIVPKKHTKFKLFYVGTNVEKKARYNELIKYLDSKNLIEIYGPQKIFGKKNSYRKYKSYKGPVPCDGKTILSKINEAGICLALNSKVHNSVNFVSNRIFEGAASGAIIICDKNEFNLKYFKDSVYYVDINKSENEINEQIRIILEDINSNPEKAYNMACEAQEIFKQHLALDSQVNALVNYMQEEYKKINSPENQTKKTDIICDINEKEDIYSILEELDKQYYKNIRLIILAPQTVYNEIKDNIKYEDVFVEKTQYNGKNYYNAIKNVTSPYFMFMDIYSAIHKNHLVKNIKRLEDTSSYFAYSGTYIRKTYDYELLNKNPYSKNELLSFLSLMPEISFNIEERFALCSVLFKSEILKLVKENEALQINSSFHIYLVLCSLVKAQDKGQFTYTYSSGYKNIKSAEELFTKPRWFYKNECRCRFLLQTELQKVFMLYNTDINESSFSPCLTETILNFFRLKIKFKIILLYIKRFLCFSKKKKKKYDDKKNHYKYIIKEINILGRK